MSALLPTSHATEPPPDLTGPRASAGTTPASVPPTDARAPSAQPSPTTLSAPTAPSAAFAPAAPATAPATASATPRPAARPAPLASALDALGVMLLHVSLDGRVLAWSRAARERLGWDGGVRGERLDQALSAASAGVLARRVATEGPVSWEAAWGCADGSRVRVRVAVELESQGDAQRLLCVATPLPDAMPARAEVDLLRRWHDAFFTRSPLPACVQGADLRIIAVNPAYCTMMGYEPSELIGRDPMFMVAPEHLEDALRMRADTGQWARLAADGSARTVERRYVRRDGATLLLRVRTRVTADPRGGFWICSLTEDLTADRRRVDEVIRDNEMFRLLFEESPSPKSIQDANFRMLKVNRSYCEMFGYRPEDLIGRDPIEWMAPEDREMIVEQRQRALRGEHLPLTLTRRILQRDGTVRICRLMRHTTHASDGSRIELITLHDETEEIRMQQRLRAYWQRFERFFEQAPVGLMISDAGGRVALVNRMLEDIVGRSRDRLIGLPDALGEARFEAGGRGARQRTIWSRDDGSTRWIDRIDRELEDLDGRPMRLTVVHDVTRERTLRDELIETEERFRQFAELVDDAIFVAQPGLASVHYVNGRFEAVWGTPMADLVARPLALFDHVLPEHRSELAAMFDAQAPGHANEAVIRLQPPGQGVRAIRLRVFGRVAAPLGPHAGDPAGADEGSRPTDPTGAPGADRLFAVAEDITETLRLEQARLEDAIKQRDMLVREVHHRIKNNLQGVAGLLQQSASSRPELAESLGEVVGRIQAIAQVHGLQVSDGEALVARRVIAAVFENLGRTFGIAMALTVDDEAIDRWLLPEQEAVPLALVVNELGTNAIKHRSAGAPVTVRLDAVEGGIALEISSTGSLPEGFDFARLGPSPSGLGLVKALLPRRGARLELLQQGDQVTARAELTRPSLRERGQDTAEPISPRPR
jgi:PAS domain S-box-containing protein